VRGELDAPADDATALGHALAEKLRAQGADEILAALEKSQEQ
jgi:hypothetical protein